MSLYCIPMSGFHTGNSPGTPPKKAISPKTLATEDLRSINFTSKWLHNVQFMQFEIASMLGMSSLKTSLVLHVLLHLVMLQGHSQLPPLRKSSVMSHNA